MDLPDIVAGFSVLPVSYSPQETHIIYARAHVGSKKSANKTFPDGRTLFLVNVPPDATERELTLLFKYGGTVERVIFDHDMAVEETLNEDSDTDSEDEEASGMNDEDVGESGEPPAKKRKKSKKGKEQAPTLIPLPSTSLRTLRETGRTAHVVFLDASSLERALAPSRKVHPWPNSPEPRGLAHFTALYDALRPPLDAVRAHADSAMDVWDYELARRKRRSQYRKGEAVVDEDGFTLVTRGGAYGQTLGGGVGVATKKFQEGGESSRHRKKKSKEKEGFYAFQKHEKRRQDLINLKKGWEEDKAKVEKLRESRRFKPY